MTIQKADFTASEQALIQTWIDTEIPARIASYQTSVTSLTASLATIQAIEDVFEKIYTSWANLHINGFLLEIAALNGDSFATLVLESEIQSTAENPLGTRLFPSSGGLSLDPLFDFDLRAQDGSGDFDTNLDAWTGTPGGGSFAATGYDEREALVAEAVEWVKVFEDDDVIYDMWVAEEAALTNQLAALSLLDANLSTGQGGKANLAAAISTATSRLATVQGYIAAFPTMPSEGARLSEITTWLSEIDARVDQIRDPGDDQEFVRDERYYWLRQRLNLSMGSLSRLQSTNRSIDLLNSRITDLQNELVKYTEMGF